MNRSLLIKGTLAISLILFLFCAEHWRDIASKFDPDHIQEILAQVGSLAPVLYIIATQKPRPGALESKKRCHDLIP